MKSCPPPKSLTLLATLLLLMTFNNCARRGSDERYVAPNDEFSYLPPPDWQLFDYPGLKYKVAASRPVDGFAPNINVTEVVDPVSLDEFVEREAKATPQIAAQEGNKNFSFLNQSKFATQSGLGGHKLVFLREEGGKLLRHSIYFFEGKSSKKLILTCTVPADGGEAYDQVFDSSMKTLKVGSP